jgi:hypothetical protein
MSLIEKPGEERDSIEGPKGPSTRIPKAMLEEKVARAVLDQELPGRVQKIVPSEPPLPDILVMIDGCSGGIEICALIDEAEMQARAQEERFLAAVNVAASKLEWPDVTVRLVMQDDGDVLKHRAAPAFEQYRLLPEFLDGIFVENVPPAPHQERIMLNQRGGNRPSRGLFPRNATAFAEELQRYLISLADADFRPAEEGWPKMHHAVVTEADGPKTPSARPDPWAALLAKLNGSKSYEGNGSSVWLIVHNHPQDQALGNMVWHKYWHRWEEIIARVQAEVLAHPDAPFSRVYFADYSQVRGSCRVFRIHVGKRRSTRLRSIRCICRQSAERWKRWWRQRDRSK